MDVSIIIPSFNRYPLNLFCLFSLENQTYDLSKMEVILIDDSSTDDTPLLKQFSPRYKFKYIRNESNLGLAATRNKGLRIAKGKVVIFLDAEMIVDAKYVENHLKHHQSKDHAVVIGGRKRHKLYSCLFPDFNSKQTKDLSRLLKKKLTRRWFSKLLGKKIHSKNIGRYVKRIKSPSILLKKEDIRNFSQLEMLSITKKHTNNVLEQLGDHFDFSHINWLACVGNLSVKKDTIDRIGGYDEDYKGWGTEDHDLAFRLKKAGVTFVVEPELIRYHQEHPIVAGYSKQGKKNRVLFQKKHPVLDVCIRSLKSIQKEDYTFMNFIMNEHYSLKRKFPGMYEEFNQCIVELLQVAAILDSQGKQVINLMQSVGIQEDRKRKARIINQRNEIDSYKQYPHLIKLFDLLINR
ncbi:glycosyltransferase family 2 protein [Bacillus sp. EB01]|uniref:glycosyltransferase family 2 protein n=1 Tax=Bacillus sp. EB01 TaxID=1347086 RepID=UPI0005C792F2|nr:glycosyltransferase [Bacillus sp. EB01]